jgi:multicomponent Na+:H+ antiporter subunit E
MLVFIFLLWLIFNGRVTTEIVILGLVITALLYGFCYKFLDYRINSERRYWRWLQFTVVYILNLCWEIIIANLQIIKLVLSPVIDVKPCLMHFQAPVQGSISRVILANSITLTPGTITVDMDDQGYYIHVLDAATHQDITQSSFVKLLRKMEDC